VNGEPAVPDKPVREEIDVTKSQSGGDYIADDPKILTARLQDMRSQRIHAEREANQLPQVLRGIALTRRERDAGVSQQLRTHRAHLERVFADAEDLIVTTLRVALRTQLRGGDDSDPVVYRAHRAIDTSQAALRALSDGLEATS
jgi:hypothetical protein